MPESSGVKQRRERAQFAYDGRVATLPLGPLGTSAIEPRPILKQHGLPPGLIPPEMVLFDAEGNEVKPWRNYVHSLHMVLGSVVDQSIKRRVAHRSEAEYRLPETVQSFFDRQAEAVRDQRQLMGDTTFANKVDARNVEVRLQQMTTEIDQAITLELFQSIPALNKQYQRYLEIAHDETIDQPKKIAALQQITSEIVWVDSVKALPSPSSVAVFEALLNCHQRLNKFGVRSPRDFAHLVKRMAHDPEYTITVDGQKQTAESLFTHGQEVYKRLKKISVITADKKVVERKTDHELISHQLRDMEQMSDFDLISLLFVLSRMYSQLVTISHPRKQKHEESNQQERGIRDWQTYANSIRTRHRSMMKAAAIADLMCLVPTHQDSETRLHLLTLAQEAKPILRKFLSNTATLNQADVLVLQQVLEQVLAGNMAVSVVELKTHLIQPPQLRSHDWSEHGSFFRPHGLTAEHRKDVSHTLFALLTSMATVARDPRARPTAPSDDESTMSSSEPPSISYELTDRFGKLMNGISADSYQSRRVSTSGLYRMMKKLVHSGQISAYVVEAHAPLIQRQPSMTSDQPDTFSLVDEVFLPLLPREVASLVYVTDALRESPSASDVILYNRSPAPRLRRATLRALMGMPSNMERQRRESRQLQFCYDTLDRALQYLSAIQTGNLLEIDQHYKLLTNWLDAVHWSNKHFMQMKQDLLQTLDPRYHVSVADSVLNQTRSRVIEILLAYLPNRGTRSVFARACEHIVPTVAMRIIGGPSSVKRAMVGSKVESPQPPAAAIEPTAPATIPDQVTAQLLQRARKRPVDYYHFMKQVEQFAKQEAQSTHP